MILLLVVSSFLHILTRQGRTRYMITVSTSASGSTWIIEWVNIWSEER